MYTFHKSERLCSKKLIAQLFVKGNRGFSRFPFRFSWVETKLDEPVPIQVLFVVSKRNFPKAVSRNKIKRQLREFYRLAKPDLYKVVGKDRQIALSIMYIGNEEKGIQEIANNFKTSINQLSNELSKSYPGAIHLPHQDL